jgi:hypothetical protein
MLYMTSYEIERTKEALSYLQDEADKVRDELRAARLLLLAIIIESGGSLFVSDLSTRKATDDRLSVWRDEKNRGMIYAHQT